MAYSVKEIFYTLQGEGAQAGLPAVFCRFTGCNLWSGREADRASAACHFCDTDFVGTDGSFGGKYPTVDTLVAQIQALWPAQNTTHRLVVLTGGEPLMQVNTPLINALHAQGFRVAVETNGTLVAPPGIDWLCVSPKAGTAWVQQQGQELKIVWPQSGHNLSMLAEVGTFDHRFLQPMDGPHQAGHVALCIEACLQDPRWRLSLQTHKISGIR